MGELIALNRRQITSDKVIHEGNHYRVFSDGGLARISHRPPASLAGWAGCHHHRSFAAMIA